MRKWSFLYAFLKLLFAFIHRIFYRKIIVTGSEHIPKGVPVIIAPNHQNALMDPLAVIFTNKLQPVFLARADIFRKPFFRFLLQSIKMLPVYRVRDGIGNISRNDETFEGTNKILEAKQSVALFPEAQHHGARFLLPLKKGVPRIAFLAEEKNNFELNVHVVPAGINFSSYGNFRSVLQVNYGKPILVKSFQSAYEESQVNGFNALRDELSARMRPLMIDIRDKEFYNTVDIIGQMYNKQMQKHMLLPARDKTNWFSSQKRIIQNFEQLNQEEKESIRSLTHQLTKEAKHINIKSKLALSEVKNKGQLAMDKLLLVLLSPIYLIGFLTGIIPYSISNLMIGKVKDKQYDSTFRYVLSAISLPAFYALYTFLISHFLNLGWWGLPVFFAFFYLGTYALDYQKAVQKNIVFSRISKFSKSTDHPYTKIRQKLLDLLDAKIGKQT